MELKAPHGGRRCFRIIEIERQRMRYHDLNRTGVTVKFAQYIVIV